MDSYKSEGPASGAAGRAEAEDQQSVRGPSYTTSNPGTQVRGRYRGRARTTDAAFIATRREDRQYFAKHPRRWCRVRDRTPEDPVAASDVTTTRILVARFFKKLIGIDVPPGTRDRNSAYEFFMVRVALPRDPEIDAVVEAVKSEGKP
jgi:hypothetical protein